MVDIMAGGTTQRAPHHFDALFLRLSVQPALSAPGRIIFSILAADHR